MRAKLCPGCGQPMLPKGVTKRPNEYDHAQGCPEDAMSEAKLLERLRECQFQKQRGGLWKAPLGLMLPEIIEALERGTLGARLLGAVERGWLVKKKSWATPGSPFWRAALDRDNEVVADTPEALADAIEAHERETLTVSIGERE